MSDIQIQDPYTSKPKFYKYESDDRQILVNLLHEYSDKLMLISQELEIKEQQAEDRSKFNEFMEIIFKISMYIAGSSLVIICLFTIVLFFASKYQMFISGNFNLAVITTMFLLFTIAILTSLFLLQLSRTNARILPKKIVRNIYLLKRDARIIADKLEKVMHVTIEIQDRIEINLARKLELDLRIADAESALEYYYSIIEPRSN